MPSDSQHWQGWGQLAHIWANQEAESTVELEQLENFKALRPVTVGRFLQRVSTNEKLPILPTQHYQLGLSGQTLRSSHTGLLQTLS